MFTYTSNTFKYEYTFYYFFSLKLYPPEDIDMKVQHSIDLFKCKIKAFSFKTN